MCTIIKRKGQAVTLVTTTCQEIFNAIRTEPDFPKNMQVSYMLSADYKKLHDKFTFQRFCGLVVLRIANLPGPDDVRYVMRQVTALPYTHMAWRDADGRTVYVVGKALGKEDLLPTCEQQMRRLHAAAYKMLHYFYTAQLMMTIDTQRPSLDDEVPYSYDPEAYFNAESTPVIVDGNDVQPLCHEVAAPSSSFPCLPGMNVLDSMAYVFHSCRHKALEKSRADSLDENERTEKTLVLLADYCHKAGLPMPYAMNRASWTDGWSTRTPVLERIFVNAYERKINAFVPFGSISSSALLTLQTEGFLSQNYELRKNMLTGIVQYRERNGYNFDFEDLTDEVMNTMTIRALKAGLGSWDKDIRRLTNSNYIHRYDPLEDYLTHLPAWDGEDHVASLAARVPTDLATFPYYLHIWLLSMVAHWQGKDKLHGNAIVPLFIGEQGCGKSTFASIILPPELRDYYNDKVDFRSESDIMSALSRFALINIDEFDSLKKSQQPTLKYLLSKSEVKVRPAYGKIIEHRRRYASFVATTNLLHPLVDRTGSRRFICVPVRSGCRIDTINPIDYPQLYAQLCEEIRRGSRYWFNEEETNDIQIHNTNFQKVTDLSDIIDRLLLPVKKSESSKDSDNDSGAQWLTLDELTHYLQHYYPYISFTPNTHKILGTMLREKNYAVCKTKSCNKYLALKLMP